MGHLDEFGQMEDSPEIMALPHPQRTDACLGEGGIDRASWDIVGITEEMESFLRPGQSMPTEHVLNRVEKLRAMMHHIESGGLPQGQMNSLVIGIWRGRLRLHGDPVFEVTPALQQMLEQTDIGDELPVSYFTPPYPVAYIRYAPDNPYQVYNAESQWHTVEGAYIAVFDVPAQDRLLQNEQRNRMLGLSADKPARVVEVTFMGVPKSNSLDDASRDLVFTIQDDQQCLRALLERHFDYFEQGDFFGRERLSTQQRENIYNCMGALAKILLYMNLPQMRQRSIQARSELLRQAAQKKNPKKRKRLERQARQHYDRIQIGPTSLAPDIPPDPSVSESQDSEGTATGRSVRPHWRRGHFRRVRHGPQRSEVSIRWIEPTLVKASQLGEQNPQTPSKKSPYIVR